MVSDTQEALRWYGFVDLGDVDMVWLKIIGRCWYSLISLLGRCRDGMVLLLERRNVGMILTLERCQEGMV